MRWLLLITTVAACGDEPAVCADGEAPAFGAATVLLPDIAEVEIGDGEVAVLGVGMDGALRLRGHDFDGGSLGETDLGAADGSFEAGAAWTGPGTWAVLWSAPLAGDRHALRFANVEAGGAPRDQRDWSESGARIFVHGVRAFGGGTAAVWQDGAELKLGVATSGAPTVTSLGAGGPAALAAGDGELAVVWTDAANQVHVIRAGADGRLLGAAVDLGPLADYLPPGICWDGGAYVVAYTVRPTLSTVGDVFTTRIIDGGRAGEPRRLSDGTGTSWAPAIACRAGGHAVAWHHTTGTTIPGGDLVTSQIQFVAVAADGAAAAPLVVEDAAGVQAMLPRVGTDGARDAVSWTEFGSAYRQKLAATRCTSAD